MKTQILFSFFFLTLLNYMAGQEGRLVVETEAADGIGRFQIDMINTSNGNLSASVMRFITGTSTNQVESGLRNFPLSYNGVDNYAGYLAVSNSSNGMIFRNESGNSDFRFLIGGFPIDQHQKMILDQDGNLGIGAFDPVSKLQVKGGDIYLEDIGSGVIMKSPNGTCWRLTVSDAGEPQFNALMNCP